MKSKTIALVLLSAAAMLVSTSCVHREDPQVQQEPVSERVSKIRLHTEIIFEDPDISGKPKIRVVGVEEQ